MSEEFPATVPSDRAVEQALVALKKGAHLLKYGRRGKPKFCPFRLSTDEKLLIWYSGQEEKQLRLSSTMKIIRGQKTTNFQRQLQPERESQSFSIIYANGQHSLDLICKDKVQADSWCLGLRAVISRCQHSRLLGAPKNRRGAQSCINSPASYMRRKHNLGISEETTKYSEAHSLCGSPTHSMSERCFSDGLSCSSNSFYSESSLSSMQNAMDIFVPNSPYVELDDLKKRGPVIGIQNNVLNGFKTPPHGSPQLENHVLRDVLIWGEGMEGGCLGGGFDKLPKNNEARSDALLPKLLESTMALDVQKLSLGAKHAALVTKQGEVFCWGEGSRGRLGNKVDMDVTHPKIVDSLSGVHVKSVVCGEYQTCALTFSGEIYTWGDNCYGIDVVGEDGNRSQWLPHRIAGPLDGVTISQVACGEWHMAIVSSSGQLFTYGDGTFGVLGHGNLQSISQPKEVESLKDLSVKSVACGPWHTAAIVEIMVDRFKFSDPCGKLFTWGDGDKGKLGHTGQEKKLLPTCVAQLVDHDFVQVACGRMVTVALTNMGKVYTMGSSVHGQLGNPHAKDKSITTIQGKLKNEFVREVSSGSYHIAVLTSSGSVYTWGKGGNGQLGLGDREDKNSPILVEALRDRQIECITCGSNFTAAICLHKSISSTDQSACKGCGMAFGFTRKNHNCYNCGLCFCHACSSKKATNAALAPNKSKHFRVCDPCFKHLKRITLSSRLPKVEECSPRFLSGTPKAFSDMNTNREEAATTPSQMILTGKSSKGNSQSHERKNTKFQGENQQPSDPISSFSGVLPRWGQVSCPVLFENNYRENPISRISVPKNQLSSSPVCSRRIRSGSKSPISTSMNVDRGLEAENILTEEIKMLRAEAECLEKLCQTRSEKIQECKQKIEEAWSLAKEEAAKSKAAKEVIKVLTLKLHSMSEKFYAGREMKDRVNVHMPQITSIPIDTPTLKGVNTMLIATHLPPEVRPLESRKVDSLCSSPIMFSNTLKSTLDGGFYHDGSILAEESIVERTDSKQNGFKALKLEWVEKYEPGVYITFITLPSGQKGLKRVRFSRKRFTEKEAEGWWEENELAVYQKYEIEGYISSNQDDTGG
ncbi:PH, RCC1 and FYVE domains-containing protein 1-like [Actinidia eriantha]|uniref:PH, RCC1 and FYVE domains-containing protein 1-like n=1 Tax=Actinidia eriantha TaxID=165200 RepID=UPI00258A9447|nr:PH, RCC1 and FYVE domains-containing protein 1-like [Actinidia eriantha]